MDRVASMTVFVKVVDSGGLSAAARKLNLAPATVTHHIQALEERVGARLLNRTTRKLSLTEIGKEYYERCAQILAEIDEADRVADALQSKPRGTLRLNCSPALAAFVAPVIADYALRYPETAIDMAVTDRMVDLVEEGFDLAIRMTPVPESSMITRRLAGYRFLVCAAPSYLARHGTPRVPADLTQHNCLRYAYSPFGDEWRFAGRGREQAVRVSGNLVSNSAEALKIAAVEGQGLWSPPRFVVAEELRAGRLVPVLADFPLAELTINAVYPHRHHVAAKVRSFIDLTVARFAAEERWAGAEGVSDGAAAAPLSASAGRPRSKG